MNTRNLALAALTALSLGVGSAIAQEGPSADSPADWAAVPPASGQTANGKVYRGPTVTQGDMPQSGASDRPVPAINYELEQDIAAAGGGG